MRVIVIVTSKGHFEVKGQGSGLKAHGLVTPLFEAIDKPQNGVIHMGLECDTQVTTFSASINMCCSEHNLAII